MIEIDGSQGEGGGQILRTSLALSMCTGQPFTLRHIRAKRPKPGLQRQHLACVRAAKVVSNARVRGAEPDATTLVFEPGQLSPGEHHFDVGSAGSSTLVLQTVWPALLQAQAPSRLQLVGGTHNPMAPPYPFIERCYAPLVCRLGTQARLALRRHGFAPQGGGEIEAVLTPAADGALKPFDLLQRGALHTVRAECVAPGLARDALGRALAPLETLLREALGDGVPLASEAPELPASQGPGLMLMVTLAHAEVCELLSVLGGRRGVPPAALAGLRDAVRFHQGNEGALGEYLTDQWALPLALAVHHAKRPAAYSSTVLSLHTLTNFEVIERFLPVRFSTAQRGLGWTVTVVPRRA